MKEQQWETLRKTSISLFLDSRLLYTQPIMSEEDTAHTEIRATLDAVKKESRMSKWAAVKDTVLKPTVQSRISLKPIQGVIPQPEEQVMHISNKVAVEKEVLNKDKVSNSW